MRPIKLLMLFFRFVLFILTVQISHSKASRVSDKIYSNLQSNHYCGRRFNATNQMGCSSNLGGNSGVVWIVKEQADLDHILKTGPTPPYIAVLSRNYFTSHNLLKFKDNTHRVSGVVFIETGQDVSFRDAFSPEDRCPIRNAGLYANDTRYSNCKRNFWLKENQVSGLMYEDIPYPIFLINKKESIDEIESCFSQNNISKDSKAPQASYPLCSIQLDSFMLAVANTQSCLNTRSMVDDLLQVTTRRCDAISNQNIFAYFKPVVETVSPQANVTAWETSIIKPQSVVMLAAKLSSSSMFTDLSPGADSVVTSLVTMLAVADALARVRNSSQVSNSEKNIAFALFDSEPFDYTGSNRMAHDMNNNTFPMGKYITLNNATEVLKNINLESIEYFVNLDQLALYPKSNKIYLHLDPDNENNGKSNNVNNILSELSTKENLTLVSSKSSLPLPPAPAQEFIRQSLISPSKAIHRAERLFGLVVSNYDDSFNNLFYHSIYDNSDNINQVQEGLITHLTRISNLVAKALYKLAFGPIGLDQIQVQRDIVESLLQCYLTNAKCPLFTKAWQAGQQLPSGPIQTYKDPAMRSNDMNGAITSSLLAYFLGNKRNDLNLSQCVFEDKKSLIYNYRYVNGKDTPVSDEISGLCIESQVFLTTASSLAYEFNNDQEIVVNNLFPAWTMSLNAIRNPVRIYLEPSPVFQWCIFILGIGITAISFLLVIHGRSHMAQLQNDSLSQTETHT